MEPIKLTLNPFQPNHKQIGDLHMMVHTPLLKQEHTQDSYPTLHNVVLDKAHPETHTRRVLVSFQDPKTEEFEFDLDGRASHAVTVKDKQYQVTLRDIGEEEVDGYTAQKFLYFIFYVEPQE